MYRESKETIYSDIPLSFTAHPVNGNIVLVKNSESIKQSVKNIVLTNFYERPYNIFFGGNLIAQLFENLDSSYTKFLIRDDIERAIRNNEPRAELLNVGVIPDYDRNALNVTVRFIPINESAPVDVEIVIERTR